MSYENEKDSVNVTREGNRYYGKPKFVYNRERAQKNWEIIKSKAGRIYPEPKIKWSDDGYEVPFGHDVFGDYGELMPDGLVRGHSIFYRDPQGEFPWLGNYYNLGTPLVAYDRSPNPILEYDREVEENLRLVREFGTPMTKDNNNQL